MTNTRQSAFPWHAWVISIILLLFGLASAFDHIMSLANGRDYYLASGMTEAQIDYFLNLPFWAHLGWAIGVWSGLIAALGLLLRFQVTYLLFALTVAGNITFNLYLYFFSSGIEAMGMLWFMPLLVAGIHLAMVFYAKNIAIRQHAAKF